MTVLGKNLFNPERCSLDSFNQGHFKTHTPPSYIYPQFIILLVSVAHTIYILPLLLRTNVVLECDAKYTTWDLSFILNEHSFYLEIAFPPLNFLLLLKFMPPIIINNWSLSHTIYWLDLSYCKGEKFVWDLMHIASSKACTIWQNSPIIGPKMSLLLGSVERKEGGRLSSGPWYQHERKGTKQ